MPSGWFEIIVPPDARVAMTPGSSHRLVAEARLEVIQPRAEVRLDDGQDVTIAHDEVFTVLR
jgi:hypothetical protein